MIRERFLARSVWEAKLRRWGCEPADPTNVVGILRTAEVWIGNRGAFLVPVEADGRCDLWRIKNLAEWHGQPPPDPLEAG